MDKYTIVKNGLVLSLDKKGNSGYFNIIIKNGKIFLIDYERKFNEKEFKSKNPDAVIIDADQKLVMPGFFNSRLISFYALNKIFLKKCTYENISSWLSLKLIDKYLSAIENSELARDLLRISYSKSLLNGEVFICENSSAVTKDFFDLYLNEKDWIKNYFNLNVYDPSVLSQDPATSGQITAGFKADEDINNYTLSGIKKFIHGGKRKLTVDASLSQKGFESIRKVFGKPLICVLNDMEMVTSGTAVSNPTHLSNEEIEILRTKRSTVIVSPSDYLNMFNGRFEADLLLRQGLNIVTGTGLTGIDILSELRILSQMLRSSSFESIIRTAIHNPSLYFGISNVTGVIEKNKSADMIFFDLKDLRNEVTLPEADTENICEFVIKNLTTKDISDVMLKGQMLVENRILSGDAEELHSKAKSISDKLFSAGKYFEFKEKYLMRSRVDKLLVGGTEEDLEEKEERVFVDMTETGEYDGEGEFTILGAKEEEFEKPHEKEKLELTPKISLKEIKSFEYELNLFEDTDQKQELKGSGFRSQKKQIDRKHSDEERASANEIKTDEQISLTDENTDKKLNTEETEKSVPKKSRMKFGFGDES